ncbi:2,3-dihydro-2,3-dihydroxybenzoate dehydrogenase [Actinomadura rugatobispora]|uniref:2,3-dihydro-2,3-dihydroxybenzoate dehydrogenase n=1 Tax=Actinomadura rugatobispora TaxID=1994 RepID=A0ABW1AB69_9ACTN|nr:2,3-dihydro-2,3-dihydroxybenzoate dehydrogenase [Actinomadura rugatobispora]
MTENGFGGKVAVVTGAAGGIGAAVARRLAAGGAVVAALDVDAERLSTLTGKLSADGAAGRPYAVDVGDSTAVDEALEQIERDLGPVGVLANVAGVLRSGPVTELDDATWAEVMRVNLDGVLHCSRAAARSMVPRREGAIVTVASNAGSVARSALAAYSASKAAAAAFTKCLGLELAPHGIRCNVVSPGSTNTTMLGALLSEGDAVSNAVAGSLENYRNRIPLNRVAEPEDIADVVAFMASEHARHLTMQELIVDGGATLRL